MARGASRPSGTRTSPPPISTITGLYAFGRQPEAIHWDLAQLAGCLSLVADAPAAVGLLGGWSARFDQALIGAMLRRLGVARRRRSRNSRRR